MISIILHGACGHMGRVVNDMVNADPDVQIVAGVDAFGEPYADFPVYKHIGECTEPADVIVDFSTAAAVSELLAYGVERNIPMVVCTTGLSEEQTAALREASGQVAILRSGNMSLGINLLMKLVKEAAKVLSPAGYDAEIIEEHHRRKLDAPSGTAEMLADSIREGASGEKTNIYGRHDRRAPRDPQEIGISSVRGGTIVGVHDVLFAGEDEVIELKHTAYSRAIFAKGALAAAKFLAQKGPGLFDMSDVIGGA